ncbi:MAG: hypothetical protein WA376_08190, partial [Terrimicrobiaceae bacterium]
MKTIFKLPSYYEGLRARRIKQSGRLWLVRVVSEEGVPVQWPYWFVMIRNFNLEKDRASGATSIGVWRFGHEDQAFAKFAELEPLYPPYIRREPTPAQLAVRNRVRIHGIQPA